MANIYLTPNFIETQRQNGILDSVLAEFISRKVPEVATQIDQIRTKYGRDNEDAVKRYLDWKVYGTTEPLERFTPVVEQEQAGIDWSNPANPANRQFNPINKLAGSIGGKIEHAGVGVRQSVDDFKAGKQGLTETGLQVGAQALSGVLSPATETINMVGGEVLRATGGDKLIQSGVDAFAGTDYGKSVIDKGTTIYESMKESDPQGLRTAQTVGKAALDVLDVATVGVGKKAATKAAEIASQKAITQTVLNTERMVGKVDNTILEGIKAVRPSQAGKRTASDLKAFDQQATLAVKTIINNKPDLNLVDEFGEEVADKLPQNLRQFADAIEQTREVVFRQYDDLAKQAGEAGAQVDLTQVANEVIDAVSDPKFASLEDQSPEIADYLLRRAAALEKRQFYTAEQAQQAVKNYNASLKTFYNNPTYENYAKASIDAMLANNVRKGLDDAIENVTGGQYSALKQQYGALKAIEADVVKRAVVDARKNTKGMLDFTDVLTGGDLLTGLLTFNPAQVARGGFGMGIKKYLKALNDPNRNVRNMFRKADALLQAIPTP